MSAFIQVVDYFIDTNGTAYSSHVPTLGGSPSNISGNTGVNKIESNSLTYDNSFGNANYLYFNAQKSTTSAIDLLLGLNITGSLHANDHSGVIFRGAGQSVNTFYILTYAYSGSNLFFNLVQWISGAQTSLKTFNITFSGNKLFRIEVRNINGLTINIYNITNGINTLITTWNIASPALTSIGSVGAFMYGEGGAFNPATDMPVNFFSAMDAASIVPIYLPVSVTGGIATIFNPNAAWVTGTTFTAYGPSGFTLNSTTNISGISCEINYTTGSTTGPVLIEGSDGSTGYIQILSSVSNSYYLGGPTGGSINTTSSLYTLAPSVSLTDVVTITSSIPEDTISPSFLSWSSSAIPKTFTITGSSFGPRTITLSSSNSYSITNSTFIYSVAIPFTVSAPSTMLVGIPSTITYTPQGTATDTLTLSDTSLGGGGAGGTFNPPVLIFNGTSSSLISQYTPANIGAIKLSATSADGALFTPANTISYSVISSPIVTKSGKLIAFKNNSSSLTQNNAQIQALVTSLSSDPTVFVNGQSIQIGTAQHDPSINFVLYLLECGSVQSIAMVNSGTSSYTSPTFTWNNDGGGSGLVLANGGVGTINSGLILYTIDNFGSGYTQSFAIPVATGQSPSQIAWAWVNVVSNAVVSVVPLTGSVQSYGIGYTGTSITNISLPGSNAYQSVNDSWTNAGVSGSGLVVHATVGNYVVPPGITNGGTGFTSPPTFTITDSGSGGGATCVSVMSGPLSTDSVTCSTVDSWILTTVGLQTGLSPAPLTNATVVNSVGKLEADFSIQPTMPTGFNAGSSPSYYAYNVYFPGKNKLKASNPWQPGYLCLDSDFTIDSNYYPQFWTPNSWVSTGFYSFSGLVPQFTRAQYQGIWSYQYDDDFYNGGLTHPSFTTITNASEGVGATLVPVNGPHTVLPVAGTVTLSGTSIASIAISNPGSGLQGVLVTINGNGSNAAFVANIVNGSISGNLVPVCTGHNYSGTPTVTLTPIAVSGTAVTIQYNINLNSQNAGGNIVLYLNIVSGSDGIQHVHNPWVIAPNNTIDRSKPFATDDNVVANLTNNGNGPGSARFMDSIGGPINPYMVDVSDILNPNMVTWQVPFTWNGGAPSGPPNSPTFSGTCTSGSPTITGISDTSFLSVGNTIVGNGIPGYPENIGAQTNNQAKIISIVANTSITISVNAKLSGNQVLSVNPTSAGNVTFTKVRFFNTNSLSGTYPWSSPRVYSTQNWATTGTDSFGQYLDITGGPFGGVNDNGNLLTSGPFGHAYGAAELTSPIPHGLKTGFYIDNFFAQQNFSGTLTSGQPTVTGITGGGVTKLPGQIVTGTGIPSSPPTTIISTTSTTLTLSANATANGSQSLSLVQAFNWHFTGVVGFNYNGTPGSFPIGPLWVTGPNSIVVLVGTGGTGGTGVQNDYIDGTAEIPIWLPFQVSAPNVSFPYEFLAAYVSNWLNTVLHLNLSFSFSNGYIQSVVHRIASNIGPTNEVHLEMGNEHWNAAADVQCEQVWENQQATLAQYYPNGTQLYPHYTPSGSVQSFVANGSAISNGHDGSYCLRAANMHYVFVQEWISLGLDPNRIKLIYGGQYGAQSTIQGMSSAIQTYNLIQEYIAYAAYFGPIANSLQVASACPAGYPGVASPGNWPVDATNEYTRYYLFYGSDFRNTFSNMLSWTSGTTLKPMGYEGGQATLISGVPFSDQAQQDALYHSSYYDTWTGGVLALQQGNPNVAGSGWNYYNYFSLYADFPIASLWKMADSVSMPIGMGLTNQFVTPQGGLPGTGNPYGYYQTNQTPGIQALHDWIGRQTGPVSQYLTGPTTGTIGQSLIFTVTLPSSYSGIIVPIDSSNDGIFIPQFLYYNNSSIVQTFVYVAGSLGPRTITLQSSPNLLILDNVSITLTIATINATSAVLTGPPLTEFLASVNIQVGVPSGNFTVTPNGFFTGVITMSDSNKNLFLFNNGTFTPSSLTFNNSMAPQTFTYTANSPGVKWISIIATPSITVNSPIYCTAHI